MFQIFIPTSSFGFPGNEYLYFSVISVSTQFNKTYNVITSSQPVLANFSCNIHKHTHTHTHTHIYIYIYINKEKLATALKAFVSEPLGNSKAVIIEQFYTINKVW